MENPDRAGLAAHTVTIRKPNICMTMKRVTITQTGFICLFFMILGTLPIGCSDSESSLYEEGDRVHFSCDGVDTRSAGFTGTGPLSILSMGIYAAHTESDWTESSPLNFMKNQKVARTDADSPWSYSPEVYWPGSGNVSFFAYAPYNAAGLTITGSNGTPQFDFDVASTSAGQVDLLVANPLKNHTKTSSQGYANISLRHALTRISFAARINTSSNKLPDIHISQITMKGIYHKGSCSMDGQQRNWIVDSSSADATTTYTLNSTASGSDTEAELSELSLIKTYQDITAASGHLFLMPQQLSETSSLEVQYSIDDTPAATPLTIKLANALTGWQAGESIRYQIAINYTGSDEPVTITLEPIFIPWENIDTDVTIDSDPYLDLTDISVSAYDAAATRIYFYTNQPAKSVFIDPVGTVSATNQSIDVKTAFCNIAKGDVLSDATSNFHFDETTHKGYFDLINYDTGATGSGSNSGRQAIVIKLYAGKLVRYITVQPVVTTEVARNDATPYIGTFHRSEETGERIVTWHATPEVEWTATIMPQGTDYSELCIDRMASPDYQTNSLYSYSPRNPEGATVGTTETSVQGKGRVYFRIGWKNATPQGTNRHALVRVTYKNGNTFDIYCRQGEEPEGLTDSNTDNPFSVYNLMNDGVLVDYPTQGGLLSQWGRPTAWPAIGSTAAPSKYPTDVDKTLSLDVNICPETYAYPDKSTIAVLSASLGSLPITWGYYADGYFDRRNISSHRVEYNSTDVASAGVMLYLPTNLRSVFMPTIGYRNTIGEIVGIGTDAGYWSKENDTNDDEKAIAMLVTNGSAKATVGGYSKANSFYMRCIKILNPATLYFDANGGENAPRAISVNKGKAPAHIPSSVIPNDYRLDNYEFDSWNTQKNGTGTKYAPGEFYPSNTENLNTDVTLYAQWKKLETLITVDYADMGVPSGNLLTAGNDIYAAYTGIGNNGNSYVGSEYTKESVYPKLQFSALQDETNWTDAYNACRARGEGWRLPRASELYWITQKSNSLATELLTTSLWSGTNGYQSGTAMAYYKSTWASMISPLDLTGKYSYRCVHAAK